MLLRENIDSLNFNIFVANKIIGREQTLVTISYHYLLNNKLMPLLNQAKLSNFLKTIYNGYRRDVAYHNDLHGADVVQSSQLLLEQGMGAVANLNDLDMLSFVIACACHDYKHDGFTN